ncbi:MAG TPA: hypothetical protein VHG91_12085 [Longimicrobium sp.]|nr:hypothetical protein [Longimicrobium sp.]
MRRYRIWADTHSTGILDGRGRFVRQAETTIGEETWIALQRWVEDYDDIIPLPVEERERHDLLPGGGEQ